MRVVESGVLHHHSLEPIPPLFNDLLIFVAILILLVEIYRKVRQTWLRMLLSQNKKQSCRENQPCCARRASETAASVRKISEKRTRRNAKSLFPGG
jgi:hypothetical protein